MVVDEEFDKWEKAIIEYQNKAKKFYKKSLTVKTIT